MSDPQVYGLLNVLVAGALLTEHTEATINRNSKSNPIETVAKGYAGESPGAASMELDVTSAVPEAGFEWNAQDWIEGLIPIEFGIVVAGQQCVFKGFVISDSIQSGVNKPSTYNFKVRAGFAKFA